MKQFLVALILILFIGQCWSQNNNQVSKITDEARYEIVQSELGRRYTFKIDKYTGRVDQMVQGDSGLTWQPIIFEEHDYTMAPDISKLLVDGLIETMLTDERMQNPMSSDKQEAIGLEAGEKILEKLTIRYQLFLSGQAIRDTFLLDVETGKSWQLVQDEETEILFWRTME